jgi:ferredoxin
VQTKKTADVGERPRVGDHAVIDREGFPALLLALWARGYRVIGPVVRDGAITYDEVRADTDLPIGWTDEQAPGHYRLVPRSDEALFGYNVGPQAWKRLLHLPTVTLWHARRDGDRVAVRRGESAVPKYSFLGVRACELHAIGIQNRVFLGGQYRDPHYAERREHACVIAVNCGQAGGTCFCASMGTGPRVERDFDLCLTEVLRDGRHYFVAEVGTELGAAILTDVPHTPADGEALGAAEAIVGETAAHMGRRLETDGIHDLLMQHLDHPRWEQVAGRCLSCGNCTMVCPTCFCTTIEDSTDLTGTEASRTRIWDSCFTADFSHIAGGTVRASTKSRYRQWMTHKLATWQDQFDTFGCVGCGRCITWCPVGIDITEEAAAIRADVASHTSTHEEA